MRRHSAARIALAAALSLVVLTSGCAASGVPAPSSSTSSTTSASSTPPTESATEAPALSVPDPRTITGPSTAAQVDEITPVGATPTPVLPVTLTGEDGVSVEITDVSRLLALDLYGTLVETVIGLGLVDNLVGRSISNSETAIADLPVVTQNGHELNAEAILSLQPTFVIMDTTMGPPETPQQLRDSGVPVLLVSSERGIDLITEQIEMVASALGVVEQGALLVERFERELEVANEYVAAVTEGFDPVRMAFVYVRGTGSVFFVMGKGSGGDDLIAAIGGEDAATSAGMNDIVPASAETLLVMNPEVLLTMTGGLESTGGLEGFLKRPGVSDTTAGQNQRVVDMSDGQVLSFGPSYPAVLIALTDAVYQPTS
ncbi:heme/hemin ABC transporter substrate-binding protein [Humidisolicoccus flavus]|uniref:heme/hemin ABC transporter substrate-binding protein n=1 Tax=Humidisolicoccus flavus TaxID=3111414 RepID=UPI0032526602